MQEEILQLAGQEAAWQEFLDYKKEKQNLSRREEKEIEDFILQKAYLPLCEAWKQGIFPATLPVKRIVNKEGTDKKRVVYSYQGEEGLLFKFITFWLYRYDEVFCDNCYAFRRGTGVGSAVHRLKEARTDKKYCLKADISNYFNSIVPERLMQKLEFLKKEESLYALFERILLSDKVLDGTQIISEKKVPWQGHPLLLFWPMCICGIQMHILNRKVFCISGILMIFFCLGIPQRN